MKYAYVYKGAILHIVDDKDTAVKYAKEGTRVIETTLQNRQGQPYFDGKTIHVYSANEMRIAADGYGAAGKQIDPIPELADLYIACTE